MDSRRESTRVVLPGKDHKSFLNSEKTSSNDPSFQNIDPDHLFFDDNYALMEDYQNIDITEQATSGVDNQTFEEYPFSKMQGINGIATNLSRSAVVVLKPRTTQVPMLT